MWRIIKQLLIVTAFRYKIFLFLLALKQKEKFYIEHFASQKF